jgi:hypothetical protein
MVLCLTVEQKSVSHLVITALAFRVFRGNRQGTVAERNDVISMFEPRSRLTLRADYALESISFLVSSYTSAGRSMSELPGFPLISTSLYLRCLTLASAGITLTSLPHIRMIVPRP